MWTMGLPQTKSLLAISRTSERYYSLAKTKHKLQDIYANLDNYSSDLRHYEIRWVRSCYKVFLEAYLKWDQCKTSLAWTWCAQGRSRLEPPSQPWGDTCRLLVPAPQSAHTSFLRGILWVFMDNHHPSTELKCPPQLLLLIQTKLFHPASQY